MIRTIGTGVFFAGLVVISYGTIAFWLIQSLPPNGGYSGRLPSLYLMGIGVVAVLFGLAFRDLRVGQKQSDSADTRTKGIPATWSILMLVLIIAMFFVVVSQL